MLENNSFTYEIYGIILVWLWMINVFSDLKYLVSGLKIQLQIYKDIYFDNKNNKREF